MAVFDFGLYKIRKVIDDPSQTMKMGSNWTFALKPRDPLQKIYVLTIQGMRWYLDAQEIPEATTSPTRNLKALYDFYDVHRLYSTFDFVDPYTGLTRKFRFGGAFSIPEAYDNGIGLVPNFEVTIVEDPNQ